MSDEVEPVLDPVPTPAPDGLPSPIGGIGHPQPIPTQPLPPPPLNC